MLIFLFFILDLSTFYLIDRYVGVFWTFFILAGTSISGITLCIWSNQKSKKECEVLTPYEQKLLQQAETRGNAFLIMLFLFPGLLSDLTALFMIFPRLRKDYYPRMLIAYKAEAERTGKSLEEIVALRCGRKRD